MDSQYFICCNPFGEECIENEKHVIVAEEYSNITDDAFAGNESIVSVQIDTLFETIEYGSFKSCKNLEQINIPYTVKKIDHWAFSGCKKLKEIKLPPVLSFIGDSAFRSCSVLSQVAIPGSTKSIGESTFKLCKKLEEAYIPASVQKIGKGAFSDCPALTIVTTQGSAAEKYANKENIPVRLIEEAELVDRINDINLGGEEVDIMELQLKLAQKQGPAVLLRKTTGQVLIKNQIVYETIETEDDLFDREVPEFFEEFIYVLGRDGIEDAVEKYSKEAGELAHGYVLYNKEKMNIASDEESKKILSEFETICVACKSPAFMEWLYDFLPKKKNGALHIGRKTTLAKLPIFCLRGRGYSREDMSMAFSYDLVAKTESETEVRIEVREISLMENPHEDVFKFSASKSSIPYDEMLHKASMYA